MQSINNQYLPIQTDKTYCEPEVLPLPDVDHDIICVRSNMRTGKGFIIKKIISDGTKKILIVTFNNLLMQQYIRSAEGKNNISIIEDNYNNHSGNHAVHINNLRKITTNYDYVILDEIESILNYIGANINVWEGFENCIKRNRKIIVFDAMLTQETINMLKSLSRSVYVIENTYCKFGGHKVDFLKTSVNTWIEQCVNKAKNGARIVCPTDDYIIAQKLMRRLHAENITNVFVGEKHNSMPIQLFHKVQVLIYTQQMFVGVSYGRPYDEVIAYFSGYMSTADIAVQSLFRIKRKENTTITVHTGNKETSSINIPCTINQVNEYVNRNVGTIFSNYPFIFMYGTVKKNTFYEFITNHILKQNISKCFFVDEMKKCLRLHGISCD